MYRLSIIDIATIPKEADTQALSVLSTAELDRHAQFHHDSDARLFLYGRFYVKHMLARMLEKSVEDIEVTTDSIAKKPYLASKEAEFSISHSGQYVAVATSLEPIGLDLQVYDQQRFDIFDAFFTDAERAFVQKSSAHFYKVWTAIESLAKITGLGFNESLRDRILHNTDNSIKQYSLHDIRYSIYSQSRSDGYTFSIATLSPITWERDLSDIFVTIPNATSALFYSGSTLSAV